MDEDVWRDMFQYEMQNKGILELWDFSVDEHFQAQRGWLQYSLCCFAKFCCSICGRNWASSKVHLLFYMKLQLSFGQVKMHIFRQKCKVCNCATYEQPIFLVENVEVAIKCLVNRIRQKFYKVPVEDFSRDFVRDGRQDGPHDRDNCEACSKGICNYIKRQENKSKQQNLTSPEDVYTTYNTPSQQSKTKSKQQIFTWGENIHTSYNIPSQHQESEKDIQKTKSKQQILTSPKNRYSTQNKPSMHQQSKEDKQKVMRSYGILSYSPPVQQHSQTSQNSRPHMNNPSVPRRGQNIPERQSECCCIIL